MDVRGGGFSQVFAPERGVVHAATLNNVYVRTFCLLVADEHTLFMSDEKPYDTR